MIRLRWRSAAPAVLALALVPWLALAADQVVDQVAVEPVPVPLEAIPVLVWGVLSSVAALVAALIPAKKMPPVLRKILDLLASNWGHATNAPEDGQNRPSAPRAAGGSR